CWLLMEEEVDVSTLDDVKKTPMMAVLSSCNSHEFIKRDRRGSGVTSCDSECWDYKDPLTFELLALLIDLGADINAKDMHGDTVLHYAAKSDRPAKQVITTLIENGADLDARNHDGMIPFDLATDDELLAILAGEKKPTQNPGRE